MASAIAQKQSVPTNPSFSVVEARDGSHAATLVVDGELDLACADELRATLEEQRLAGRRYLRVDTSAVTFLDATVLGVLLEAHREFLARRGTLVLIGVTPRIHRLLRITGLDDVLFVADLSPHQAESHVANRRRSRGGVLRTLRPAVSGR